MNKTNEQKEKKSGCKCYDSNKSDKKTTNTEFGTLYSDSIQTKTNSTTNSERNLKRETPSASQTDYEFANDYYEGTPTIDHYNQQRSEQNNPNNATRLNKNLNNRSNQNTSR